MTSVSGRSSWNSRKILKLFKLSVNSYNIHTKIGFLIFVLLLLSSTFLLSFDKLFIYSFLSYIFSADNSSFNPNQIICKKHRNSKSRIVKYSKHDYLTMSNLRHSDRNKQSTFSIIVLTFNRPLSLLRCLRSVRDAHYDSEILDLHIWIDRDSKTQSTNDLVLHIALNFLWPHGEKHVHVWDQHVGLYLQWIDSYIPEQLNKRVVILEDDMEVSPQYFRWLSLAYKMYSNRTDIFGYTLQRARLRADQRNYRNKLNVSNAEKAFLYLLLGTWGYSPEPEVWRQFRSWFYKTVCSSASKPYVNGLVLTQWFKEQENEETMWEMWHIKYANDHRLYTVYANLNDSKSLASNWREEGLHYKKNSKYTGKVDHAALQDDGSEEGNGEFSFPVHPVLVEWNGSYINREGKLATF